MGNDAFQSYIEERSNIPETDVGAACFSLRPSSMCPPLQTSAK